MYLIYHLRFINFDVNLETEKTNDFSIEVGASGLNNNGQKLYAKFETATVM
jgi:hypothetical protein